MANPGLRGLLRRFVRERDGVSAVEFALILPFMLTLYLGGSELGDGMAIQFKATLAARTVADLATQYTNIPDLTTMNQILAAASTVATPYATANMTVTVSELKLNGNTTGSVVWSASSSGNGRAINSTFPLPTAMQSLATASNPTVYLILGEVAYPYTPAMGYAITGTINIYEDVVFSPRLASCVQYTVNGTATPPGC
ncbi:MAG TPA: TadE/TadG family type IV pilus assembly protein [Xanthobacteraceae bacterium]